MWPRIKLAVIVWGASCVAFTALPRATADVPGFRRFADSISPDGAHVLAWGWDKDDQPEKLKEWPAGADTEGDAVANYLVDALRGKVLATIPEQDHFETSGGRWKQFSGLAVSWSEDGQDALAIYEGRWSDSSILWIKARRQEFIEILPQLSEAYARFLARKLKVEDAGEISFSLPAILPDRRLVIGGRARPRLNESAEYNHVLEFAVKLDGDSPKCTLLGARQAPEPAGDDKAVEDELNKAYRQLRMNLNEAGRAALKEKQVRWLKQRESLAETDRSFFTRLRTAYLRARAEN